MLVVERQHSQDEPKALRGGRRHGVLRGVPRLLCLPRSSRPKHNDQEREKKFWTEPARRTIMAPSAIEHRNTPHFPRNSLNPMPGPPFHPAPRVRVLESGPQKRQELPARERRESSGATSCRRGKKLATGKMTEESQDRGHSLGFL